VGHVDRWWGQTPNQEGDGCAGRYFTVFGDRDDTWFSHRAASEHWCGQRCLDQWSEQFWFERLGAHQQHYGVARRHLGMKGIVKALRHGRA
jgi:hypothetical protein